MHMQPGHHDHCANLTVSRIKKEREKIKTMINQSSEELDLCHWVFFFCFFF